MKIGLKLTLAFFLIAFLSASIIGFLSYNKCQQALKKESFNKLTAVREMKANQIEDYYKQITEQLLTLAADPTTIEAMKKFKVGFDGIDKELSIDDKKFEDADTRINNYFVQEYLRKLNPNLPFNTWLEQEKSKNKQCLILQDIYIASNSNPLGKKHLLDSAATKNTYNTTHKFYHPFFRNYHDKFGYYDIFLVDDVTGNIVYTVFKEVDFGTSLIDGPFKATNIAEAFNAAKHSAGKNFVKLVDYEPYHPSYNDHASFIATPIYEGDKKIGVLVFQMPIDRINDIMTNKQKWEDVGLGKTGETYIVGEDYTLRNQSRFLIEDSTNYFKMIKDIGMSQSTIDKIKTFKSSIGLQVVNTEGTSAALHGESNTKIFPDYRGVRVLSSYRPLNITGMPWVIMSEIDEEEAFANVTSLKKGIIFSLSVMFLLICISSYFISKRITKPIKELTINALQLAKGNLDVNIEVTKVRAKDEISILSLSFRKMQVSLKKLVEELKEINHNLEKKVIDRTREIHRQKEMVEEKNREIVDSINYAQRLQKAILPTKEKVKEVLPESFILFKPKDIVSGDFYWMHMSGHKIFIAAVDCTGHGVPGAMVSVVGANGLNRCVKEFALKKPSSIMDKLTDLIIETFETSDHEVKDGMDMTLCSIDPKTRAVEFCGANNPIWIVRKGATEVEEIKADKQPIGKHDFRKPFTNHHINLNEGDCIYLFTDGYADQFGGPKGKKFKYATFKKLLLSVNEKSMDEQMSVIDAEFTNWQGILEQVDDVCVVGIRL